jgi:hypothetical protein
MRETLARDVLVAKEMKVHKRLGAINITPNIKDGSSCIRFECCGETKILDCNTNSHVWLFVYIKFGDLIAILRKCSNEIVNCLLYLCQASSGELVTDKLYHIMLYRDSNSHQW